MLSQFSIILEIFDGKYSIKNKYLLENTNYHNLAYTSLHVHYFLQQSLSEKAYLNIVCSCHSISR